MTAIPTQQDVLEAWAAVFRWNGGEPRLKADYHLVKAWYPLLDELGLETPGIEAALDLLRAPGERRTAWGYFLALMLMVTQSRGDVRGYWRVACALLEAARQSTRASNPTRNKDPLTTWLKTYRAENPEKTVPEVYADIMGMCGIHGGNFEEGNGGCVSFYPDNGGRPVEDVRPGALKKRIERAATTTG